MNKIFYIFFLLLFFFFSCSDSDDDRNKGKNYVRLNKDSLILKVREAYTLRCETNSKWLAFASGDREYFDIEQENDSGRETGMVTAIVTGKKIGRGQIVAIDWECGETDTCYIEIVSRY